MSSIPYEKNLDGVRTFALICVLLFHLDTPFLTGGYVGVDLFFMLSGYLISRILTHQFLTTNEIGLGEFWRRRAKRLFPLAFAVVAFAFLFTLAVGGSRLAVGYYSDFVAAATYVFNWHLYTLSVDYLNTGVKSPVLHYWTLAVEEQFYILWPLLFWAVAKWFQKLKVTDSEKQRQGLLWMVSLVVVSSLIYCYFQTQVNQPFAFFSSLTRAWEFGLGGIAGVMTFRIRKPLWATLVSFVGAGVILVSIFTIHQQMAFPGVVALIPTGALFLILVSIESARGLPRLLSARFCLHIGQMSYGIYLFHWPIMFLLKGKVIHQSIPGAKVLEGSLFIALTYLLALWAHYFIENKFRFSKKYYYKGWSVIGWSLLALVLNLALFYGVRLQTPEVLFMPNGNERSIADIRKDLPVIYKDKCHYKKKMIDLKPCDYGKKDEPKKVIYLFGDSVAAQWFPALNKLATEHGWKLVSRTKSACPYFKMKVYDYSVKREYYECEKWREQVYKEIAELRPARVFLSASSRYKPYKEGGASSAFTFTAAKQVSAYEEIQNMTKAKVILIKSTPTFPYDPIRCLFLNSWDCSERRDVAVLLPRFPAADDENFKNAFFVDPVGELCNKDRCFVRNENDVLMRDHQHVTATFAKRLSSLFRSHFLE